MIRMNRLARRIPCALARVFAAGDAIAADSPRQRARIDDGCRFAPSFVRATVAGDRADVAADTTVRNANGHGEVIR